MKNKYTHLIDMETDEGYITKELEATMDESGNIYFVRNDDGVHAWHCSRVHKDDWNVKRIKDIS